MRWWLAAVVLMSGCRDDDPPPAPPVFERVTCPFVEASPGETVELVRDRGFDLGNQIFQGRVGGCYTLRCDPAPDTPPVSFERQKQATLEALAVPDTSCRLEPGLTLTRSARFEQIAPRRDAWNAAIQQHRSPQSDGVEQAEAVGVVVGGEGLFSYHGTAVAGLIAHDPAVRLVLIDDTTLGSAADGIECPAPGVLEQEILLHEDPDVRAAIVASPPSQLEEDLRRVVREHRVALSNESFGPLPSAALESTCGGPWTQYFQLLSDVYGKRIQKLDDGGFYEGVSILTLRSAGNESSAIDTPGEALNCGNQSQPDDWGRGSAAMMIGSNDSTDGRLYSAFSNHGACVDAYAPGRQIVLWAPEDFLSVGSGTSFSAPLVTRLASLQTGGSAQARRDDLVSRRDKERRLPAEGFPQELQFASEVTAGYRLTTPRSPALRRGRGFVR